MRHRIASVRENCESSVSHMVEQITHICKTYQRRAPGSASERVAAEYLARQLETTCGCEPAAVESFPEHPSSFYGYFYVSATLDVLTCASFFLHPWASLILGCVTMMLFLLQFVMYRQVIDPLFPQKTGTNVTAIRPCEGEVKQRVFFNAHIDASWEFPLNYHFGGVVFEIPGLMSILGVLFYIAISVCALCGGAWTAQAGLIGLAFIPFFLAQFFTYNPRRVVDGANDDLSGCAIGIALLREMERQKITLAHTEVGVILTGSEEAGLRGAKAWCRAHANEYRDVPTFVITLDTICDPRYLMVNRRDLNGTVAADAALCEGFLQAAQAVNVPCKSGWVPPLGGATDSAAFTQGGFRSVSVTGLRHQLEKYYHTREDSYPSLNREGLANGYLAAAELLARIDGGAIT